jgi:hypothetical protein
LTAPAEAHDKPEISHSPTYGEGNIMSIVRELLDDAIALQKDGLSPSRIGLALTDRWEAEELGAAGKVKRSRSPSGAIELLFPSGEKIVWNGTSWSYVAI